MFRGAGDYLFHYTTLATALEHILPTLRFRLGPFSTMRDPAESHLWAASGGHSGDVDEDEITRLFWEMNRYLTDAKATFKVLALTEDAEGPPPYEKFGRGYAHPRLWEQYGGVHAGVCLMLDRRELIRGLDRQLQAMGSTWHGPVEYSDTPIHVLHVNMNETMERGVEVVIDELLERNVEELFFHKLGDWRTEAEYRFLVRTKDREPVFVDVSDALRAVVMGPLVSSSYLPSLRELCDPKGIRLAKLYWENGQPTALPPH